MQNIVIGTAGHVDHGKTALIRELTGIDTDRLKEEQERGITIELGFAYLTLPDGEKVGIVDVPGHEKFVKNMVAGAGGIDLVLMVIAADEGVMPQTREHMEICELLGISRGIVALTKCDLIDNDWRELVMDDIAEFTDDTFLAGAPIIPVSSVTGEGIDDVRRALVDMIGTVERRTDLGLFRLPIDRVFSMKGFGTVITGTLMSGTVSTGDTVEIMPRRRTAKVRGIEVHNASVTTAVQGQRTAVNLQGVDKSSLERGEVLAHPGFFESSIRADIVFTYLESAKKKLKSRSIVRFHVQTADVMARIILFGRDTVSPGERVHAQVLLDSPLALMAGDRFVIRSYSPVTTIGGGFILDPLAVKHKQAELAAIETELATLETGTGDEKTAVILARAGITGIPAKRLSLRTGIPPKRQDTIAEKILSRKEAHLVDKEERRLVADAAYRAFQDKLLDILKKFHEKSPLMKGISREELKNTAGQYVDVKIFTKALQDLESTGSLASAGNQIALTEHRVDLGDALSTVKERLESVLLAAGLKPPTVKELLDSHGIADKELKNVLPLMVKEGVITKITNDLYFHTTVLDRLREDYTAFLRKQKKASPADFKEMTGLTRKFIIPLMEHFDAVKLTIRVGDSRELRTKGDS